MNKTVNRVFAISALLFAQGAMAEEEAALTVSLKRLTLESATRIAQGAIDACRKQGIQIGVSVVDRDGTLQAVMRDTIAAPITVPISRQKAFTAVNFNVPTSQLGARADTPIGRLDGLVCCAGIMAPAKPLWELSEEEWDLVLRVNLRGHFGPVRAAIPVMREQQSGVITNISSIAAICEMGMVSYKASKAALNAYTHTLATGSARHGIRANVIMPGLNGPQVVAAVREHQPRVRVIYMSGYTDDVVLDSGAEDQDAILMRKPFGQDDLARVVRACLDADDAESGTRSVA